MVFRFLRTYISARRNFRKKRVVPFDSARRDESNAFIRIPKKISFEPISKDAFVYSRSSSRPILAVKEESNGNINAFDTLYGRRLVLEWAKIENVEEFSEKAKMRSFEN
uniref:Uncharacterized protein n=1 Tax=Meloidogyne incognita TaxID=6306 RepID=A0A914M783_MELIC